MKEKQELGKSRWTASRCSYSCFQARRLIPRRDKVTVRLSYGMIFFQLLFITMGITAKMED